jgi:hypothetical protein
MMIDVIHELIISVVAQVIIQSSYDFFNKKK